MNITKAFCLSMALLGTANIQAMESSDFIIQQDNTKGRTARKQRNACSSRKP